MISTSFTVILIAALVIVVIHMTFWPGEPK